MNPTLFYFSQRPDALWERGLLQTGHSGGEKERRLVKTTRQDINHGGSVTWIRCQTSGINNPLEGGKEIESKQTTSVTQTNKDT